MDWKKRIQDLWIDFLFWIRLYILSQMFEQRGSGYVASRIIHNAAEFADAFVPFYGKKSARRLEQLLTRHTLLLSEYAATIKTGQRTEEQRLSLYANAAELAEFLASINPHWDIAKWMELLYQRFYLEESLVWWLNKEAFRAAIEQLDAAHGNVQQIAKYMIDGIAAQFQLPALAEDDLMLEPAAQMPGNRNMED